MIEIGILIMFLSLFFLFSSDGCTRINYDERFRRMIEEEK